MTWHVPGFRETSTWRLAPDGDGIMVTHEFSHEGPPPASSPTGTAVARNCVWTASPHTRRYEPARPAGRRRMRPAEEIRYLVLAAQREGSRLLDRALRPLGITDAQAEVIRVLQDRQPLTLSGLGDLLICESGNSPSRLVARLVDAGLVRRQIPEHDRRHVELTLTDVGAEIAERILLIEEDLYRMIDALSEGHDTGRLTAFLRAFVADLPAGRAFERRRRRAHGDGDGT